MFRDATKTSIQRIMRVRVRAKSMLSNLRVMGQAAEALAMSGRQPSSAGRQRGLPTRIYSPSMNRFPFSETRDSRVASIQVKRPFQQQHQLSFHTRPTHRKVTRFLPILPPGNRAADRFPTSRRLYHGVENMSVTETSFVLHLPLIVLRDLAVRGYVTPVADSWNLTAKATWSFR